MRYFYKDGIDILLLHEDKKIGYYKLNQHRKIPNNGQKTKDRLGTWRHKEQPCDEFPEILFSSYISDIELKKPAIYKHQQVQARKIKAQDRPALSSKRTGKGAA